MVTPKRIHALTLGEMASETSVEIATLPYAAHAHIVEKMSKLRMSCTNAASLVSDWLAVAV